MSFYPSYRWTFLKFIALFIGLRDLFFQFNTFLIYIMKKICYRPVYNRKNRLNAQGAALLQVEAYLEKKKVYLSSHIYLKPEQWDEKRKVIKRHPNAESLNYMLREFMIGLEQKEIECWKSGKEITLEIFKEKNTMKEAKNFIDFVKKDIESTPHKASTKQNRLTTCCLLEKFNKKAEFKDITPQFVFDFESFLYKNGLQTNTVAKHMKHFKGFVNSAIDKMHMHVNDYPFRRYRIKKTDSRHSFLLPEELEKLERLELLGRHAKHTHALHAFLFSCYTGIRYSDFVNLTSQNFCIIKGAPWLIFRTIKTDAEVKLPLALLFEGKAWKIIKHYQKNLESFFALRANSTINKELIRIGMLAGINKHFSFHTARHTNATLLIYNGTSITTVQKLLGHRNITTTQIYSEVMERTIVKDLQKCANVKRKKKTDKKHKPIENG